MRCISACFVILLASLCLQNAEAKVNGTTNLLHLPPRARLEIKPQFAPGLGHKVIIKKHNESLNLTCTVVSQNGKLDAPFEYTVDWRIPQANDNPRIERGQGKNVAWLWLERLSDKDDGNYTCNAMHDATRATHSPVGQPFISMTIRLSVKSTPTFCGSQWFRCPSHTQRCIMERYLCDGKKDCEDGEDESLELAGCDHDPCKGKIFCNDRCIPPEWCCDQPNCTFGLRPWPPETHEISYVQTAFYTVIGCAMAFMFIVTILVIAICRVHIKRAMSSRLVHQNRNGCRRSGIPFTMPTYDVDVYLNRPTENYPRGVNITYNINSGVQFVGRPIEPPPYSKLVSVPPREGPPPPYVSCENLIGQRSETNSSANSTNTGSYETPQRPAVDEDDGRSSIAAVQVPSSLSATIANDGASDSSLKPDRGQSFDREYIETDALLVQNSLRSKRPISKNSWKPYSRSGGVKTKFSAENVDKVERLESKLDANVLPLSGKVYSVDDSENEGIFLETDGQEFSQPKENSLETLIAAGPSSPHHENNPPSLEIISRLNSEISGDLAEQNTASQNSPVCSLEDCSPSLNQFGQLDFHDQVPESSNAPAVVSCNESAESGRLQESQSLILPLRESFIGVQKNG